MHTGNSGGNNNNVRTGQSVLETIIGREVTSDFLLGSTHD